MPRCVCPHCSHSHKVPAKNLGMKGRCKSCHAIFSLVAELEEIETRPTPDAELQSLPEAPEPEPEPEEQSEEPEAVALEQPEEDLNETFLRVLLIARDGKPLEQPEEDLNETFEAEAAASAPEGHSGGEPPAGDHDDEFIFSETEPNSLGRKRRGTVAELPTRPALLTIANVYLILAYLHFFAAGCVVLFMCFTLYVSLLQEHPGRAAMGVVLMMLPAIIGIILLGIILLAIREGIAWMIAIEARQHEISKNLARW